jgi:hypothetical protein
MNGEISPAVVVVVLIIIVLILILAWYLIYGKTERQAQHLYVVDRDSGAVVLHVKAFNPYQLEGGAFKWRDASGNIHRHTPDAGSFVHVSPYPLKLQDGKIVFQGDETVEHSDGGGLWE